MKNPSVHYVVLFCTVNLKDCNMPHWPFVMTVFLTNMTASVIVFFLSTGKSYHKFGQTNKLKLYCVHNELCNKSSVKQEKLKKSEDNAHQNTLYKTRQKHLMVSEMK
jgi:hypothetical protein